MEQTHTSRPRRLSDVVTTIPALAAGFVVVTLLAAGPLQDLDRELQGEWTKKLAPGLLPFQLHVADRIASQPVNLPVLVAAALLVAWRARSLRPLLVAVVAEAGFYVTGLLKLTFARPAPALHDPAFFSGGLGDNGRLGISYPSGHAVEVVLIYGAVIYLVQAYTRASPRTLRLLRMLWLAAVVNCVFTSFTLGYHWLSDLVGGVVLGALLLQVLVTLDARWPVVRREPAVAVEETVEETVEQVAEPVVTH